MPSRRLGFSLKTAQRVYAKSLVVVDEKNRLVIGIPNRDRTEWLVRVDATEALTKAFLESPMRGQVERFIRENRELVQEVFAGLAFNGRQLGAVELTEAATPPRSRKKKKKK